MYINHLTTVEESFMQSIWKFETFYTKDLIEVLPEPKPHQNTISTYLKILVEKNYLSTEKEGRIYKYRVEIPLERYKQQILKEILAKFYDNKGKEVLKFLLDEKLITNTDLEEFFDLKVKMKKPENESPKLDISSYILNPKKSKKKKKKKKK